MKSPGFSLIELLVVIAIIGILASLLVPALARAKSKSQQTACLSNLRQIGIGFTLFLADDEDRFPDRRDLKTTLGYKPWTTWPASDPRGGWAAAVLTNELQSEAVWRCPALTSSTLRTVPQCTQASRPGDSTSTVTYWLWRFDKWDDPIPLDDFWGKTIQQCVTDLQAVTNNPTIIWPNGPASVELAVDPYFPSTVPSLSAELRGRAVHPKGRNTLYLDTHATYVQDSRLQ